MNTVELFKKGCIRIVPNILLNEKSKMQNRLYIMLLLVFLKRVIYV